MKGQPESKKLNKATDEGRRRRSGVVLSYAYTVAQIVVNLLYVPILLRGIGDSEYGLYQIVGSVMAYITLVNSTFAGGVTRFYCKYHSEGDVRMMETTLAVSRRIYGWASLVSVAVGVVAASAVYIGYSGVLTEFQLAESVAMLGILVVNLIVTMHNTIDVAVINANERFAFLKATQIVTVVTQPVLIIAIIQWFPCALSIVCVQLAMNVLCFAIQRAYRCSVLGARVKMHRNDGTLLRSILYFSSGVLLVLVADQVFWRTNQLVVGYFLGTSAVAVYGVASQIYVAYAPMGTAVSSVFMPRISQLYYSEGAQGAISALFTKVGRISLYPLLLVLLGFWIFGREFIYLWAGEGYGDAYAIALVVMVPYTVDLMQNLGLTILQVENKYTFRGVVYAVLAVVNLAMVVMVVPKYGAVGAAACSAFFMFIGNGIVMNIYYAKVIHLDIAGFWKNAARVAIPLTGFGLLVYLAVEASGLAISGWPALIGFIILFTLGFFAIAYLLCMNGYEKDLVMRLIRKAIPRRTV